MYQKTGKLVVQEAGLHGLWVKFHEVEVLGGHAGICVTALKIQEFYHFDGNLEKCVVNLH